MQRNDTAPAIATRLLENQATLSNASVVTGFDGFVDEMIHVVDERTSLDHYRRVDNINQFGDLIKKAAGHSSLREIVVNRIDPGGCAINMGDGLIALGIPVTTFATVGDPIHPAFQDYGKQATLYSWGNEPGRTLAYEFSDGKLMFSSVTPLSRFTPEYVQEKLAEEYFTQACQKALVIALTDWTLFPHMTACWDLINRTVFSDWNHRKPIFVDLVDPSSRSEKDCRAMLLQLREMNRTGSVTLGLNQNEANRMSALSGGVPLEKPDQDAALQQARHLQQALSLDAVVIHSVKYAVVQDGEHSASVEGPYCESPVKLTGAGDRFNAGYVAGQLLELSLGERLTLATATSGYYVRQGRSGNAGEIATFLREWGE